MRIIGGIYKGLKLKVPKVEGLRPTYDKVREALFDILGENSQGISFLDLFAGSGSVGLEALSRGAQHVVFVEAHRQVINVLKYNISLFTGVEVERIRVIHADVMKAISLLRKEQKRFDVIFSDPPYLNPNLNLEVLEASVSQGILNVDGIIIIEQSIRSPTPRVDKLYLLLEKRYGETKLLFYGRSKYTRFLPAVKNREGIIK